MARSAPPEYSPHQTSCPGNGVHSSRGFSAACQQGACGRTCTAPPACTVNSNEVQPECKANTKTFQIVRIKTPGKKMKR